MTHLHIMPIGGVGGEAYSQGLDRLAEKVRVKVGAKATVYSMARWNEHTRVSAIIRKIKSPDKVLVVAHSGGANEATIIARDVRPRVVDMLVAYHLSWWMRNRTSIGGNVSRIIEVYGWNFFNPAGRPLIETNLGFHGTRENIYSRASHVAVDDDTGLHQIVVDRVMEMMKGK